MNAEEVTKKIDLHLHRASESVYQSNQEGHLAHANTYIAYLQALNTGVQPAGNGTPDHIDYTIGEKEDPKLPLDPEPSKLFPGGAKLREGYARDLKDNS